jgi:hypothetical protein
MADITANPWSFTSADQAKTAGITSITRNGQGSALVTLSGALTGLAKDLYISVQATATLWNGVFRIEDITPVANTFLVKIDGFRTTLANLGAVGNVFTVAYPQQIEVTQMLWDQATTGSLLVTDGSGNLVWNPASPALSGTLTYMKAFPISGLVLNTIGSGTLQISV